MGCKNVSAVFVVSAVLSLCWVTQTEAQQWRIQRTRQTQFHQITKHIQKERDVIGLVANQAGELLPDSESSEAEVAELAAKGLIGRQVPLEDILESLADHNPGVVPLVVSAGVVGAYGAIDDIRTVSEFGRRRLRPVGLQGPAMDATEYTLGKASRSKMGQRMATRLVRSPRMRRLAWRSGRLGWRFAPGVARTFMLNMAGRAALRFVPVIGWAFFAYEVYQGAWAIYDWAMEDVRDARYLRSVVEDVRVGTRHHIEMLLAQSKYNPPH